jgi:hypothetical protein
MDHLVYSNMQWHVERTRQVICDALQDYGRIEWTGRHNNLEKPQTWPTVIFLTNLI